MKILIKNAKIINEGLKFKGSVLIQNDKISKVFTGAVPLDFDLSETEIIDATGLLLLPGVIDDHVHFREPGLTHKGDIYSESRAAVAGGVTSYMEMPNTSPPTVTQDLLEDKYWKAARVSLANYSFYMGATNDNIKEVLKTDPSTVCGVKVFMGSSTGNMLVDDENVLSEIFEKSPALIAAHCEDEAAIKRNIKELSYFCKGYLRMDQHAGIRNDYACYVSALKAVNLASKYNTRLHVLHLSSEKEMSLFSSGNVKDKKITAEVCVHHLWFSRMDDMRHGTRIKWNPSIKETEDRDALWKALLSDKIDVVATDHAPHTAAEKDVDYLCAPSGGPLVQHSLVAMLEMSKRRRIPVEKIVQKMCHAPADLFRIDRRGYIREGYFADLVLVDPQKKWIVSPRNIMYKCKWSPFEKTEFRHRVVKTFVNGNLVFADNKIQTDKPGERLNFLPLS